MIVINQYFGIGDIIFSMSALRSLNKKVLWPVMSHYVEGCNRAYPDITFIDWKLLNLDYEIRHRYTVGDLDVIPLRFTDSPVKDCMKNKYGYFNLKWEDWMENAEYERDRYKEVQLFYTVLGLTNGEEFNLISETFQADFHGNKKIALDNGLKNIYLKQIPGYSLFDWALVIEKATNIHVVSSSIIYLLELLKPQAKEIKIYKREPRERTHENYDYILTSREYILE